MLKSKGLRFMFKNLILFSLLFSSSIFLQAEEICNEQNLCKIGVKTLFYIDKSRERPMITELYYPATRDLPIMHPSSNNFKNLREYKNAPFPHWNKKLPLIIFSHGYMGDRNDLSWLQELLAANGYIVASVDHFGNTHYMQRAEDSLKRWNRPKDISFVLDQILNEPDFKEHIDTERIGFVGFSLGGLTGIWLAGGIADQYPTPDLQHSDVTELDDGITQGIIDKIDFKKAKNSYQDPRIKAEILLAPAYGCAFSEEGLSLIKIPLLIISGEEDQIVPFKENGLYFAKFIKSATLKLIRGKAGHFIFLSTREELGKKVLPLQLLIDDPSVNRGEIHKDLGEISLKFFNEHLKANRENKP